MKTFVSAADTARLLAVSVATLTRWRKAGQGPPAYRFGRMWKYDQTEIADYIQSCRLEISRPHPSDAEIIRDMTP